MISRITRGLKAHWPFFVALAIFLLAVVLLERQCKNPQDGVFIYPFDDTYIHLAIAKNLALHGVWGVTRHSFGACSSSLLWPVLIAGAVQLAGLHDLTPMILAGIFSALVLLAVYAIGRREKMPPGLLFFLLLAAMACAPLPMLTISGMESNCQIAFDLLFVYFGAIAACSDQKMSGWQVARLALLAAGMMATRYEGVCLAGWIILVLLIRRRWALAVIIVISAVVPGLIFGVLSKPHGGMWFPNSVLLKGRWPQGTLFTRLPQALFLNFLEMADRVPDLIATTVAALAVAALRIAERRKIDPVDVMLIGPALAAIANCTAGFVGYHFRYEAYAIVLMIVPIALAIAQMDIAPFELLKTPGAAALPVILAAIASMTLWLAPLDTTIDRLPILALLAVAIVVGLRDRGHASSSRKIALQTRLAASIVALFLFLNPLVARAVQGWRETPIMCGNIHDQQYQMSRFVASYYPNDCIALNDVGLVCYRNDIRVLDTFGLDTNELAILRVEGKMHPEVLDRMARARHVRIAIIYPDWLSLDGGTPESWNCIGVWEIPNNIVCGENGVSFFAVDPAEAAPLMRHFLEFAPRLPAGVGRQTK